MVIKCNQDNPEVAKINHTRSLKMSLDFREEFVSRKQRSSLPNIMHVILGSIFALLITVSHSAVALRFASIQMPALVQRGTNFWLACQFELAPSEQLYSVKWYKNNEEFYRLLTATTSAVPTSGLSGADSSQLQLGSGASNSIKFQQQYFSQLGLNVLMSGSNATHVRLLNASLESEGVYACEISSENLSTIRHEKEIKVYVLPNSKLNVIGLRPFYSLGERVELRCSSDFSRPAGALAWFISGQRITTNLRPFELEAKRTGEGKLERSSLTLKFKLTSEILLLGSAGLLASNQTGPQADKLRTQLRNQSLKLFSSSSTSSAGQQTEPPNAANKQTVELLKFECRFKLADVSDVTFNQLKVGRRQSSASEAAAAAATTMPLRHWQSTGSLQKRRSVATNGHFWLAKSHDGQRVLQANALGGQLLADHTTLKVALAPPPPLPPRDQIGSACQAGPLALQLEDPVILNASSYNDDQQEFGGGADGQQDDVGDTENGRFELEADEGATLNLNCATLESQFQLLAGEQQQQQRAESEVGPGQWPLAPERWRKFGMQTSRISADDQDQEENEEPYRDRGRREGWRPPAKAADVCLDPAARRRALISGKYQTQSTTPTSFHDQLSPSTVASRGQRVQQAKLRNQQQHQQQQQIAFLRLDGTAMEQLAKSLNSVASAGAESAASAGSGVQVTKSLAQLEASRRRQKQQQQPQQLRAPPLLEWFINNQEAPKSSASYSPELPLLTPNSDLSSSRGGGGGGGGGGGLLSSTGSRRLDFSSLDGSSSGATNNKLDELGVDESLPLLPSIDYPEYFANFDLRPIEQQLKLSLKLDKKHFMTPDSLVTLRCTSTQAQVLQVESVSLSLMLAAPAGSSAEQQLQQANQSHWQQRPMTTTGNSGAAAAGGGNGQIKQKYLHQYARASSHQVSSPTGTRPNYRQEYVLAGRQNQFQLNGSDNEKNGAANLIALSRSNSALLLLLTSCLLQTLLLAKLAAAR